MKIIGLIGGMSWESSDLYYQKINTQIKKRMGGFHSAKIILYSVDFDRIEKFQRKGDWVGAGQYLADIAHHLELAGAEGIALCTNTMHKVANEIMSRISVPFIHLIDATIVAVKAKQVHRVGLLGTAFTMEQSFYSSRFEAHGIDVIIPNEADRNIIHRIIYDELCQGVLSEDSKNSYLQIIQKLKEEGAEGVILGCTEIGLLIQQIDLDIPVFDTTDIHVTTLVNFTLDIESV